MAKPDPASVAASRAATATHDARAAHLAGSHPLAGVSLLLIVVVMAVAYRWADTAIVDEVTRGQGKVIPSSREQVIQSLEGGILAELAVREGDIVEKGEMLLRIDATRSGASLRESTVKSQYLQAEVARLRAEAGGTEPHFPPDLASDIVERELKLFATRRSALDQSVASNVSNLQLAERELAMTEPMVARGAVSEVEVLRLKRDIIEQQGRIQDRRNGFRADARTNLAAKEAELASTNEIVTGREDQVNRAVVRAPMRGTVKNVKITTLGGVIPPGAAIMEIVPSEDRLLVEARIRPADVAFLHPGQEATVKLTAYDYSIYGGLHARLEQISADTLIDESTPHESYYRIYVRTDSGQIQGKSGPLPILPGMVATVEILTGRKSVLEYLLKPVLKVRDGALRER